MGVIYCFFYYSIKVVELSKELIFDTGEVKLNYTVHGTTGPVLLWLHGGTLRSQSFLTLFPYFQHQYRIFSFDFRGHGKSDRSPTDYTIKTNARDTHAFITQVIKEPVVIYGHSMGGVVGLVVTANFPELVTGLVVGDSPIITDRLNEHTDWFDFLQRLGAYAGSDKPTLELVNDIGDFLLYIHYDFCIIILESQNQSDFNLSFEF